MPNPGASAPVRLPFEDSYLELLADTLESLDLPARGQFLQRYFRAITHLACAKVSAFNFGNEMIIAPASRTKGNIVSAARFL